jgi:hypothetical protein
MNAFYYNIWYPISYIHEMLALAFLRLSCVVSKHVFVYIVYRWWCDYATSSMLHTCRTSLGVKPSDG